MRTLNAPTDEQLKHFQAWRATALQIMPYMSSIMFSLRPVDTAAVDTFAVDPGHRLYVNFEKVIPMGAQFAAEGLLHECSHLIAEHEMIAQSADVSDEERDTWNVACFPAGTLMPSGVRIEDVAMMSRDFSGELVTIQSQSAAIEATPEHPFRIRRRKHKKGLTPVVLGEATWVEAKDVREGDYVLVPRVHEKRADTWIDLSGFIQTTTDSLGRHTSGNRAVRSIPLNTDTAWLIGLYVAEGSSSPNVRFSLHRNETDLQERIALVAKRLGWSASVSFNENRATVNLGTTVFGRWLKERVGARSQVKHIPDLIMNHHDPEIRAAFIEGLVDGDGNRRTKAGGRRVWTLGTSSKALAHDLVLLLAQDGMGGSFRESRQQPRSIEGKALPETAVYWVHWNPDGPSVTTRTLNGKEVASYSHRWKADEDGVWYPVNSVGTRPFSGKVYNLETPSHTYIVHGILVHNCDMAINDDLRDAGCDALAAHGVFASQIGEPDYRTPVHYLEVLRRKQKQARQKAGQQGGGKGQPQQGQGGQQGRGDGDQPMRGCGSGAGGRKGGFELGDDTMGGQTEAASAVEKELVRIATASAIRQHQEQNGIGSVPGGFAQLVDEILAPSKTPWERMLASFVRRAVAHKAGYFDATYTRRNRRRMNETMSDGEGRILGRVVAPGYIKPVPSVHFYRDTSGSVSDHALALATTEVIGIARKLGIRGDDLIVSDLDTMVHQSVRFNGKASVMEVQGRGGTDMGQAIEHACSLKKKPSVIIVATDGETGWPAERPSIPVVVLLVNVTSDYWRENVPSWAHLVEVSDLV